MKPLRQAVVAIIVNQKREILIGNSPRDGGFKFPQGGLEKDESPNLGLFREIKEELNVDLKELDIISSFKETAIYLFPPHLMEVRPFSGQELFVFQIQYRSHMVFTPQDNEFDQMLWLKADDILKLDLSFRRPAYEKALKMCDLI